MLDFFIALIVLIVSFALTWLLREYALKMSILDIPENRSSHSVITPRGGGLSFVIVITIALGYLYSTNNIDKYIFFSLFGGGLIIAGIGFWDDHKHVPARWRLIVHFFAALWAIYWLNNISSASTNNNSLYLEYLVDVAAIFYVVWVLNLFNFMDGIDGIASIEAISVGIVAALLIWMGTLFIELDNIYNREIWQGIVSLLLIMSLSILGFLVWNWPPAKIFMGDVGSGFLGFSLSVIAVYTAKTGILTIWAWLILIGVFLVDSTFTLIKRFINGERLYEAHRSHAYQHAAQRFGSHKKVTLVVLFINILWLGPLASATLLVPGYEYLITIIAYLPLIVLVFNLKAGSSNYS